MRMMLLLLVLVLAPLGADAQTPRIDRIDVTEYGIYTVEEKNCQRDAQGIQRCDRANVRHAVTTSSVPAQLGVQFGMRYRVVGTPVGAPVTIKRVWLLPAPGFVQPGKEPIRRLERADTTTVGATVLAEYGFDDSWELIPGPWIQEFWDGDRKLFTQKFTVVKQ
jgi:hypothetical protein